MNVLYRVVDQRVVTKSNLCDGEKEKHSLYLPSVRLRPPAPHCSSSLDTFILHMQYATEEAHPAIVFSVRFS